MMNRKRICLVAAAILTAAGAVLAATYVWSGGGDDNDWDNCRNWDPPGQFFPCYPSTENHDAEVRAQGGPWTIDLIEETIDDLTIATDVTFGMATSPPWLSVDSLTVVGNGSSGTCGEVEDAGTCLTFDVGTLLAVRGQ